MKNLQRAKLSVARETLRALSRQQLGLVAGGIDLPKLPPPRPETAECTAYFD